MTAQADTTTGVFEAQAARLAADIDHETALAGTDADWLREIARSANAAIAALAAARRRAEGALMAARQAHP